MTVVLFLLLANAGLAFLGRRLGTVDGGGALAGGATGAVVALAAGLPGYLLLLAFFVVGSGATRVGLARKQALGIAEPRAGARGARSVFANGGPPAVFALFAALSPAPWSGVFACAFAGTLAAAAADTASSEIGKAFGGAGRRLRGFAPVPPGTPGAVTPVGTLAGFAGALALGAAAGAFGVLEWPAAPFAVLGGFAAALGEGLLVSPNPARRLDHDAVNALSGFAGGALAGIAFAGIAFAGIACRALSAAPVGLPGAAG